MCWCRQKPARATGFQRGGQAAPSFVKTLNRPSACTTSVATTVSCTSSELSGTVRQRMSPTCQPPQWQSDRVWVACPSSGPQDNQLRASQTLVFSNLFTCKLAAGRMSCPEKVQSCFVQNIALTPLPLCLTFTSRPGVATRASKRAPCPGATYT